MTDRIFKYPLHIINDAQKILMPRGTQILHVAWQNPHACIWARIDDEQFEDEPHTFRVIGTGHEWPKGFSYIGTAHAPPFVWHVLEKDA